MSGRFSRALSLDTILSQGMRGASLLHRLMPLHRSPAVGICGVYEFGAFLSRFMPSRMRHGRLRRLTAQQKRAATSMLVRHASVRSLTFVAAASSGRGLVCFQYRLLYTLACNRLAVRWWNLGRGAPLGARREPPAGFRLPGRGQGNGCWVRRELGQWRGAGMCRVLAARGRGADRSWRPRAPAI